MVACRLRKRQLAGFVVCQEIEPSQRVGKSWGSPGLVLHFSRETTSTTIVGTMHNTVNVVDKLTHSRIVQRP